MGVVGKPGAGGPGRASEGLLLLTGRKALQSTMLMHCGGERALPTFKSPRVAGWRTFTVDDSWRLLRGTAMAKPRRGTFVGIMHCRTAAI